MSPRHVAVGLVAVAAAVWGVAGGAARPAVAASSAAPGFINVQPSQSLSPGTNVGLLSVSIASSTPITSLTVSLFASGTDALDLPMSDFTVPAGNGDGNFETWTLTNPITTSQLTNLGDYSAFVTASDSGGDSTTDPVFAGTLQFVNVVSIDNFKSNGTVFDFDHPNVTFQGTAMVLAPGGTPVPYANETTLGLQANFGPAVPFTTGADGTFSVTVPAQSEDFWIAYTGPSDTEGGTPPIAITVNVFPDHVSAALKVKHAKFGQKDSVSGTMTYVDKGVTKPVAGYTVSLLSNGSFDPVATTVTSASGQYTLPVSTRQGDVTWEVQTKATQFLSSATALVSMTVAEPNGFSSFRASLSAFGVVSVSGCMRTGARPLKIEYAAKPRGPWKVLGRILTDSFTSCGKNNSGIKFSGTFPARLGSAYYRAHYTGSFDWQPAISKTLRLSRLFTKITSFDVSPRSGPRNSHITVSGRLWAQGKSGKWRPYAHKKLIVVFKFQGTFFRYAAEPETNGAGRFRGRFKLLVTAPMFAQYNGDKTHFASASKRIKVSSTGSAAVPAAAAAEARTVAARALRDGDWVRVRAVA